MEIKTQRERFDSFDIILTDPKIYFFTRLIKKSGNLKEYEVEILKDTRIEVNSIINENYSDVRDLDLLKLKQLNGKLKQVVKQREAVGNITVELEDDMIVVQVSTLKNTKKFVINKDEYFSEVIEYLTKHYYRDLLKDRLERHP